MAVEPFKEDFFERVIDVKWETEPEVFWMIGAGAPGFVNGSISGDTHGWIWRSSDGKRWYGTDLHRSGHAGIGCFFGACWMRQGLAIGAKPIWVLAGGTSANQPAGCIIHSTDGESVDIGDKVNFDRLHAFQYILQDIGGVVAYNMNTFGLFLHFDGYFSANGQTWTPTSYHNDIPPTTFAAMAMTTAMESPVQPMARAAPVAMPFEHPIAIPFMTEPDQPATSKAMLLPPQAATMAAEITPFASVPSSKGSRADKILFKGSNIFATGKVKKGPHRGKTLTIRIQPYHYPQGGGAHGDNTVIVFDSKTGQNLGTFDTRIKRSISIGYGHYVFVVTGSSGATRSTIAWSEDGIKWRRVELGPHYQINAIAVGPRPSGATPKPRRADESFNALPPTAPSPA